MEVAQNCVAAPPANEAYRICVDAVHEDGNGLASPHQLCSNVFRCDTNLGDTYLGCAEDLFCDLCASDCVPVFAVKYCGQVRFAGGSVLS